MKLDLQPSLTKSSSRTVLKHLSKAVCGGGRHCLCSDSYCGI